MHPLRALHVVPLPAPAADRVLVSWAVSVRLYTVVLTGRPVFGAALSVTPSGSRLWGHLDVTAGPWHRPAMTTVGAPEGRGNVQLQLNAWVAPYGRASNFTNVSSSTNCH